MEYVCTDTTAVQFDLRTPSVASKGRTVKDKDEEVVAEWSYYAGIFGGTEKTHEKSIVVGGVLSEIRKGHLRVSEK